MQRLAFARLKEQSNLLINSHETDRSEHSDFPVEVVKTPFVLLYVLSVPLVPDTQCSVCFTAFKGKYECMYV